jgi:predicted O-methyltransferase YrrM
VTDLLAIADEAKGFLPDDEAAALRAAAATARPGVWLEIGTYCGKSTVHLGGVARDVGAQLVTVDYHRGS